MNAATTSPNVIHGVTLASFTPAHLNLLAKHQHPIFQALRILWHNPRATRADLEKVCATAEDGRHPECSTRELLLILSTPFADLAVLNKLSADELRTRALHLVPSIPAARLPDLIKEVSLHFDACLSALVAGGYPIEKIKALLL